MADVIEWNERPQPGLRMLPAADALKFGAITIRDAAPTDMVFIDRLQKPATKAVGWMPTGQLEGHIAKGHVIIAEAGKPVGYCIGVDRYFKREDVGVIYQMNIEPAYRRGLVGATLLKAMFERSAYGVRLFCCWCAQDLAANHFWESMGFVPLAFRTGSRSKGPDGMGRVHIFWQKRIREGDDSTPWWYPSQTGGGAIREDRIVLPIPPGVHWSEAKPRVLPGVEGVMGEIAAERAEEMKKLGPEMSEDEKRERRKRRAARKAAAEEAKARESSLEMGGLRFAGVSGADAGDLEETKRSRRKAKKEAKARVTKKNNPRLVAMARELRDRWLEQVAAEPGLLVGAGKYQVSRQVNGELNTNELANKNGLLISRPMPHLASDEQKADQAA